MMIANGRNQMIRLIVVMFAITAAMLTAADAQEKKRGGTVIGTVKGAKDINKGKNTQIEVLAPGEEKARAYFVNFDPKIKGPIESVLKAVRAAKVGDVVELEWEDTNHGPAIVAFRPFKKKSDEKK
jgi:hypothetical protein